MSSPAPSGLISPTRFRGGGLLLLVGFGAWLLAWIFSLGPTLINDEYAAIDYFYRILRDHEFYPTPDKLHKPLSVLLGFFAWAVESPLGYEVAISIFAVIFVGLVYVVVARELGRGVALLIVVAVAMNPEVMYYSATGSTVLPFCAFSFLALLAVLRREESPRWLWVYAVSFFLAGLLRPEAWLFAAPVVLWWWPGRDQRAWLRVFVALAVIGLGPLIWFGKDYFINHDFLHGIRVATRDKAVGTGAPFTWDQTLAFFWIRIPNEVSLPVTVGGLLGAFLFVGRRGWRGLFHPFLVFPALVSVYVYLIVYLGVYPVQRYWYFDSVFSLLFCGYLAGAFLPWRSLPPKTLALSAFFFLALFSGVGFLLTRPESQPPDARWAMVAFSLLSLAGLVPLLWPQVFRGSAWSLFRMALLVALALSYVVFLFDFYSREVAELKLEAAKQRDMQEVAAFLKKAIPPGRGDRIMIPSRRNEQLNWLFRDRELPETITFREAFYLKEFKGIDFLELHPDWLVFIPHDFQFWGPDRMFGWLEFQDQTVLKDIRIQLVKAVGLVRIFQVIYPPAHPPAGPLPAIP